MNALEMPFAIGDTLWWPFTSPHQQTIVCPICRGRKFVTVLIGDD